MAGKAAGAGADSRQEASMTIGRGATFTWLGHAGVEVTTPGGQVLLIDPWFGNPNSPRAEAAQERCDVLLVTHGHFDHFDAQTLDLARRLHPTMPCIHELSLYLGAQLGDAAEVIGMNAGGTVETHGLRVTMVPAVHSSGDVMGGDRVHYFGEPIGFVIELENGFRIYDSGDTTAFGDMALIRELYKPDLAIIPIGGHFTMDPAAAAVAVGLLGVRDVLPVHWGTFPILAGTPTALQADLDARGIDARAYDWKPGETVS
jgi:L-ascorbate metabolism protein UlaG (beta-lactamase superfamily)